MDVQSARRLDLVPWPPQPKQAPLCSDVTARFGMVRPFLPLRGGAWAEQKVEIAFCAGMLAARLHNRHAADDARGGKLAGRNQDVIAARWVERRRDSCFASGLAQFEVFAG